MPSETWVDFKAVKAAVSMEMVLERYGLLAKLTRKGDRLVGLCPIHHKGVEEGKSNSQQFSVSLAKHAWKCFAGSCGKHGNQIDLVAALEGCSFRDAALKLAEWFHVGSGGPDRTAPAKAEEGSAQGAQAAAGTPTRGADPRSGSGEAVVAAPAQVENKPLTFELKLDAAHPYLAGRGLTPETVAHFGLGVASRGSMKGRACVPIHDLAGHLVAYAGRWAGTDATIPEGEGKWKLPPGFRKGLEVFNAHRVPEGTKRVILVEGFWSVLWLYQNGFAHVVAAMGSALSREQVALLARRYKGVQVFFDDDGTYPRALQRLAKTHVLIIDDLGSAPLEAQERRDLREVLEVQVCSVRFVASSSGLATGVTHQRRFE